MSVRLSSKILLRAVLSDLWRFTRRPRDAQYLGMPAGIKFKIVAATMLMVLVLIFPLEWLSQTAADAVDTVSVEDDLTNYFTPAEIFLQAVLLAPVLEELMIRWPLRYNRLFKVFMSPGRWRKIFPTLARVSCVVFALLHLINFDGNVGVAFVLVAPLLVGPQFVGGIVCTFLRVRLGFWWGVLAHAGWNGIVLTIDLLSGGF